MLSHPVSMAGSRVGVERGAGYEAWRRHAPGYEAWRRRISALMAGTTVCRSPSTA
jgi:hypothetical protein